MQRCELRYLRPAKIDSSSSCANSARKSGSSELWNGSGLASPRRLPPLGGDASSGLFKAIEARRKLQEERSRAIEEGQVVYESPRAKQVARSKTGKGSPKELGLPRRKNPVTGSPLGSPADSPMATPHSALLRLQDFRYVSCNQLVHSEKCVSHSCIRHDFWITRWCACLQPSHVYHVNKINQLCTHAYRRAG